MSSQADEDIFAAAIMLANPADQDAYVLAKCEAASEQAQRILELLSSHRQLSETGYSTILNRQFDVLETLLPAADDLLGKQIGPYHVLERLGEGGMGIVYLAEQTEPVRRQVALKVLKPGMDSHKVLSRFELERQVLASLDHPGMTRILDAGVTNSSRPYFAMELVRGSAVTTYCNSVAAPPEFRLRLMIQLCSAIQHAHSRGIIHRDIKPSNILVTLLDGKPVVKVIDFGIAKAINDSFGFHGVTQHTDLIGTPAYMSPEQSQFGAQHVDVCSDVYSLGVVLYELLTGTTPLRTQQFKRSPIAAITELWREDEVQPPSRRILETPESEQLIKLEAPWDTKKLQRYLKGELDCIARKVLNHDRSQRYQSALELQRDLNRFLENEPIEAVPPNWLYSLKKFATRHRALATTTALAGAMVLVASIAALTFGIMATRSNRLANQQLQKVLDIQSELVSERDRAVASERRARLLAQYYLSPSIMWAAVSQFCADNLEDLKQVNPELKDVELNWEDPDASAAVYVTLSDSNLMPPDERIIVYDDFQWLVSVISDVSNKNVDDLFSERGGKETEESRDNLESEVMTREAKYKFTPEVRRKYFNCLLVEIHKIPDHDIPLLADTEECLGFCALDENDPQRAQVHFEEALRVRHTLPKQRLQTLQAQLLLADSLMRQQRCGEADKLIEQARAELATITTNPKSVKRLLELADSLQGVNR